MVAMTTEIHRAHVLHVTDDVFASPGAFHGFPDGGVAVRGGTILAAGDYAELQATYPDATTLDHRGSFLIPGLVDTHVHLPQLPVLGMMGLTLLDWLDGYTFPAEERFADADYARRASREFLDRLVRNGTTSALVFGAHQAEAMEVFFQEASESQLRLTAGLVLGDHGLPAGLLTTSERAEHESLQLIRRWHGRGRLRYAVTPRFAVSASGDLLAACRRLLGAAPDLFFTTHLNEMPAEIAQVAANFPASRDYLDVYGHYGLVTDRSLFAHNVHPRDSELERLAASGSTVCHCPSSNLLLGSGMFSLERHLEHGVHVALGTDVGAGSSYSVIGECLHAAMHQMHEGRAPRPAELLWLATLAGARALKLDGVGAFLPGYAFDAVRITPPADSTLEARLQHARASEDALGAVLTLAREESVSGVWVAGEQLLEERL